jgi:hypothetical protein
VKKTIETIETMVAGVSQVADCTMDVLEDEPIIVAPTTLLQGK